MVIVTAILRWWRGVEPAAAGLGSSDAESLIKDKRYERERERGKEKKTKQNKTKQKRKAKH